MCERTCASTASPLRGPRSRPRSGSGTRRPSTAHLTALMKKGWIELRPGSPRFIRLLKDDLPLVVAGPIAAGEPILADERVTARIPRAMADWFPRPPDFFLRVQGDSMNCLGFITGSIVAIKSQPVAESGEVIVAKLEGEVTLKRYVRKDEQRIELHPESTNPEHRPIAVDLKADSFEIAGVAVGALIGGRFQPPELRGLARVTSTPTKFASAPTASTRDDPRLLPDPQTTNQPPLPRLVEAVARLEDPEAAKQSCRIWNRALPPQREAR